MTTEGIWIWATITTGTLAFLLSGAEPFTPRQGIAMGGIAMVCMGAKDLIIALARLP